MHKIQIACLNPNKSVSDRNRIREFFPWNDMGETPLKIPEESCLSSRLFSGRGGEVWAQSCVTHMLWYGSLSSPSAVSVTNLIRADELKHSTGITLPEDLSVEGVSDVRGTQMEKYFSEAPLRCLSSIWQAERHPSHKLEEEDQLWTTWCTVELLCFWGPTHCVVVADVHNSSQVSKNLTQFHVWMKNFRFCLKC